MTSYNQEFSMELSHRLVHPRIAQKPPHRSFLDLATGKLLGRFVKGNETPMRVSEMGNPTVFNSKLF